MAMDKRGLTKLLEELGELAQIAAKKSAYINTDLHPDGKLMMPRMAEEMGDVLGAIAFVMEEFNMDEDFILERAEKKFNIFTNWNKQ